MRTLSGLTDSLRKSECLKWSYHKIRSISICSLVAISPVVFANLRYRTLRGTWPNLWDPQSFDEKLLWLNLYWRHSLKTRCGDKYTMRSYVSERGLEHVLPELLQVCSTGSEVAFDKFPERFVLKCTHGCKFNIICKEKSKLDYEGTRRTLDAWLRVNFARRYGELHYATMKPRIICEAFLDDMSSEVPSDYKVLCFYGKAHCTMVCTDRVLV
jgi:hypothetical protein